MGARRDDGVLAARFKLVGASRDKEEEMDNMNPKELVKDLADKIGIHQLYAIVLEMRGEGTDVDRGKLKIENEELKAHIEYLSRQSERMKGEIKALAFSVRCNGVSGGDIRYD